MSRSFGRYDEWTAGVDSDDEDDLQEDYRYTKDSILWCIEATPTMLEPMLAPSSSHPSDPTPTSTAAPSTQANAVVWKGSPAKSKMEECLRAAYAMMKRKVIASPKDHVGIVIWNTASSQGDIGDNCYLLLPLQQITAQNIRFLKDLLEKAEADENFLAEKFRPNEGQNIVANVFSLANNAFRELTPNAHNRAYWVTDNDDPIQGVEQLFHVAKAKRMDLYDMKFHIETFFVPPTFGSQFDLNKFYGDVITLEGDEEGEGVAEPVVNLDLRTALEGMITAMRTKESQKRVAFKIPFVLGKDLSIGIVGYNMIGEETKKLPTKVDLNTQGGQEVVSKTVYKDSETGAVLDKKDIKKYLQVGRDDFEKGTQAAKIFFNESDVRKVKTLGRPPSLKLLGFKPREGNLRFWETVKHSYFIYPDEDRYSGSTRTFASLLKTMIKKDVIGYASFIPRTISRPQVVILIAQAEKLNAAGVAIEPNGIHVCQLPFADDIRDIAIDSTISVVHKPTEEDEDPDQPEINQANKIIKYFTKPYNPDVYPNPALNYFYETLAAVALDEEIPEPDDRTLPLYETIHARVGKYVAKLKELVPPDQVDPTRIKTSNKKRVVKKDAADLNEPPPDLSEFVDDLKQYGNKLTVANLKAALKQMGEKTSGNKPELMERAVGYLVEHGLWEEKKAEDEMDVDEDEEDKKPRIKKKRKVIVDNDEDD
ncbi:ATP-dependent DNA helicase II subunit 1 [Rhodotorula toruloides]